MRWFDFTVLGIMLLVVIVQTIRSSKGMGLILLEAVGLMGCARISVAGYLTVSRLLVISKALALGGIFVVTAIIWIIIANLLHGYVQWSWGNLDYFFGFFFGVVCAWVIAHIFLRELILIYGPDDTMAAVVADSVVSKEILYFRTFNSLFNLAQKASLGPEVTTPEKVLEKAAPGDIE